MKLSAMMLGGAELHMIMLSKNMRVVGSNLEFYIKFQTPINNKISSNYFKLENYSNILY